MRSVASAFGDAAKRRGLEAVTEVAAEAIRGKAIVGKGARVLTILLAMIQPSLSNKSGSIGFLSGPSESDLTNRTAVSGNGP